MFSHQAHMDATMSTLVDSNPSASEITYTATFQDGVLVDNSTTIVNRGPTVVEAPALEQATLPALSLPHHSEALEFYQSELFPLDLTNYITTPSEQVAPLLEQQASMPIEITSSLTNPESVAESLAEITPEMISEFLSEFLQNRFSHDTNVVAFEGGLFQGEIFKSTVTNPIEAVTEMVDDLLQEFLETQPETLDPLGLYNLDELKIELVDLGDFNEIQATQESSQNKFKFSFLGTDLTAQMSSSDNMSQFSLTNKPLREFIQALFEADVLVIESQQQSDLLGEIFRTYDIKPELTAIEAVVTPLGIQLPENLEPLGVFVGAPKAKAIKVEIPSANENENLKQAIKNIEPMFNLDAFAFSGTTGLRGHIYAELAELSFPNPLKVEPQSLNNLNINISSKEASTKEASTMESKQVESKQVESKQVESTLVGSKQVESKQVGSTQKIIQPKHTKQHKPAATAVKQQETLFENSDLWQSLQEMIPEAQVANSNIASPITNQIAAGSKNRNSLPINDLENQERPSAQKNQPKPILNVETRFNGRKEMLTDFSLAGASFPLRPAWAALSI